jgi:hypothetical protein
MKEFWDIPIIEVCQDIQQSLALALCVDYETLAPHSNFIKSHIADLIRHALQVTSRATYDMVSVQIQLAKGSRGECEWSVHWDNMGAEGENVPVCDWALGLVKIDEKGARSTLERGEVITRALFRYTKTSHIIVAQNQ